MADETPVWLRFTKDHDDREPALGPQSPTTAYKAGMRCGVTRGCADRAKKLGRAVDEPTPAAELAAKLKANPYHRDPPPPAPPAPQAPG